MFLTIFKPSSRLTIRLTFLKLSQDEDLSIVGNFLYPTGVWGCLVWGIQNPSGFIILGIKGSKINGTFNDSLQIFRVLELCPPTTCDDQRKERGEKSNSHLTTTTPMYRFVKNLVKF